MIRNDREMIKQQNPRKTITQIMSDVRCQISDVRCQTSDFLLSDGLHHHTLALGHPEPIQSNNYFTVTQ